MIYGTIHQLKTKGFNVPQIATQLNVIRNRVYDYLSMDRTMFNQCDSKRQRKVRKLDPYEILSWLYEYPTLKASKIEDWLRERYPYLHFRSEKIRFDSIYLIEKRE